MIVRAYQEKGSKNANEKRNNKTRKQLQEYHEDHKQVFVGKISGLGEQGLFRYEGRPIDNYEYDFAIPRRDPDLMTEIQNWQHDYDIDTLRKILQEIHEVDGIFLLWT